jgi:hypothetical protein
MAARFLAFGNAATHVAMAGGLQFLVCAAALLAAFAPPAGARKRKPKLKVSAVSGALATCFPMPALRCPQSLHAWV